MKKVLIALCCVFSIFFISCASKQPAPDAQTETETTDTPETEEDSEVELVSEEETVEVPEGVFPEPEDFEEPEVITLEPADIVEEPSANKTETEDLEVVEQEEPPAIIEEESGSGENAGSETESAAGENKDSNSNTDNTGDDDEVENLTDSSGVIDISEDDSSSENENIKPVIEVMEPSRSVTLKKFEYLEVTYPGNGWIFMGLTDNSKDLAYYGRKLGTKDTKFTLQARNAGTKIAHFYKNDPLSGKYLDDFIEIIILPENGSNKTHIDAPEYKIPVKKVETKKAAQPQAQTATSTQDETPAPAQETTKNQATKSAAEEKTKTAADSTPSKSSTSVTKQTTTQAKKETSPAAKQDTTATVQTETKQTEPAQTVQTQEVAKPDVLLKEAQVLYNEKEFARALNKVNQFLEFAADNRDEGLYLKGQILEAKSEVRDIKGSMEAYTSLTKNYPASKLWDSANKRIIYLKRFYLEVR